MGEILHVGDAHASEQREDRSLIAEDQDLLRRAFSSPGPGERDLVQLGRARRCRDLGLCHRDHDVRCTRRAVKGSVEA